MMSLTMPPSALDTLQAVEAYVDTNQTLPLDQYLSHRVRMRSLVIGLHAQVVVELGTAMGRSTRIWADALEDTGGHCWTVDIAPPLDNWLATYPLAHRITTIQQDALKVTWETSQPIDVLYIDDAHTYPHVLYELRHWAPWVRAGGRILLDDIAHRQWAYTEPNTAWQVLRSVAEFCQEVNLPFLVHPHNQGLGEIIMTHPVQPSLRRTHLPDHPDDAIPRA